MTQVTYFLCEGIDHVPAECKFYHTVQRVNQQAKDGLSQLLGKTPEDGRPKTEVEMKDMKVAPETTTKSCLTDRRQEHLPGNCSKKREKFPTMIVEYEDNEIRDLLALELPKNKKKKIKKKDNSKVLCFHCKELGHYADKCLERDNKADRQGSVKKNLNHITCFKCKQMGHYFNQCTENGTSRLQ
jgi:hypothetical protein